MRVSLLLSTICVTTVVMVLRFPVVEQSAPVAELLLQILVDEVASTVTQSATVPVKEPTVDQSMPSPPLQRGSAVDDERAQPQDWRAMIPNAAREALENAPPQYSLNPVFDEKRRHAAVQFAPSTATPATPIWENVEKDAMGRSVLWSGDCYRVIDDPNAGSREAFETFGQYIIMCMNWKDSPKQLPWVSEIRNRRAGLALSAPPIVE